MKEILTGILLISGSAFVLIAAIGIVKFNDLLSRMHATTKATSFGLMLLLCGVSIHFYSFNVTIKALLVIIFIYLTAPLAAHSIAKSAEKKKR